MIPALFPCPITLLFPQYTRHLLFMNFQSGSLILFLSFIYRSLSSLFIVFIVLKRQMIFFLNWHALPVDHGIKVLKINKFAIPKRELETKRLKWNIEIRVSGENVHISPQLETKCINVNYSIVRKKNLKKTSRWFLNTLIIITVFSLPTSSSLQLH